mmetsp:Transcript_5039/g.12720  ORF Transcript_5039/g.12720 Transcript_5039/m.12720 type:complete len:204 (+) Transcript_5039:170-781(+)
MDRRRRDHLCYFTAASEERRAGAGIRAGEARRGVRSLGDQGRAQTEPVGPLLLCPGRYPSIRRGKRARPASGLLHRFPIVFAGLESRRVQEQQASADPGPAGPLPHHEPASAVAWSLCARGISAHGPSPSASARGMHGDRQRGCGTTVCVTAALRPHCTALCWVLNALPFTSSRRPPLLKRGLQCVQDSPFVFVGRRRAQAWH